MTAPFRHFIIALALLTSGTASAGFYVDDGLLANIHTAQQGTATTTTRYLSFYGRSLSRQARADLDMLINGRTAVQRVSIRAASNTKKGLAAANSRASTVRTWLLRKGIEDAKINVSTDLDPDIDSNDTDVAVIITEEKRSAPQPLFVNTTTKSDVAPARKAVAERQTDSETKLEFVRKIMTMAMNKTISHESAIRLVNDYLASAKLENPVNSPASTYQPTAAIVVGRAQPSLIASVEETSRVWHLDPSKSLRDNITDWAAIAGYATPRWLANNPYQVGATPPLQGTFIEVLGKVADSVPSLDFKVSKVLKTVEVNDSPVALSTR